MDKIYDVFISHSKEDAKLAIALCHYLEQNNLRCWIAPRDVTAGKDYAACIIEAIQGSHIMVVVFSEFSNQSHHVKNEVERAFNHNLAILPFRIRNIIPAQSLEYFLGATHWLDALEGNAENYFDVLLRNCLLLIKGEVPNPQPKRRDFTEYEQSGEMPPGKAPMFMNVFSFSGRIRRAEYGISFIINSFLWFVMFMFLGFKVGNNTYADPSSTDSLCYMIIIGISSWFILAQGAKRCHDLGKSGWYQIIPFYFAVLIFLEGNPRGNIFGANPKILPVTPQKRPNTYLFALITVALLIIIMITTPHYSGNKNLNKTDSAQAGTSDTSSIIFKNNTLTTVYLNINNVTDTIAAAAAFRLSGKKNSRVTATARTWVANTRDTLGEVIQWNIDTTFNQAESYYYNLNILKHFLLKVINTSDSPVSSVSLIYNSDDSNLYNKKLAVKVPNDGQIYYLGYFTIGTHINFNLTEEDGAAKNFVSDSTTFDTRANQFIKLTLN